MNRDEIIELQDALNEALEQLKQLRLQYQKQNNLQEQLKQLQQEPQQTKYESEFSDYKEIASENSQKLGKVNVKRVKWLNSAELRDSAQQVTPRKELGEIEDFNKDNFPNVVNVCLRCQRRTARLLEEKNGPSVEQKRLNKQNKCLRDGMKEILEKLQECNSAYDFLCNFMKSLKIF